MRVKTLDKAVKAADAVKKLSGTNEYIKGDPWYQSGQYCGRADMNPTYALSRSRFALARP